MQGLCESYRSAMEKLDDPCGQLTFLGFELVSMALSIWLPEEKSTELRQLIQTWLGRTFGSRKK